MRFIVYGAGAIGGVVGGRLFEHGNDVVLIAPGTRAAAMRAQRLRLDDPGGSTTLPVAVVEHPTELAFADDDVVLLAVKSQHTIDAVQTLAAVAPPNIAVVCLQN